MIVGWSGDDLRCCWCFTTVLVLWYATRAACFCGGCKISWSASGWSWSASNWWLEVAFFYLLFLLRAAFSGLSLPFFLWPICSLSVFFSLQIPLPRLLLLSLWCCHGWAGFTPFFLSFSLCASFLLVDLSLLASWRRQSQLPGWCPSPLASLWYLLLYRQLANGSVLVSAFRNSRKDKFPIPRMRGFFG